MSENNSFEIVMQQKMDAFQLEPAASDWQAIYDELHPRKKRRIIWWWFPLIAALGAGVFWIYNERATLQHPAIITTNTDKKQLEPTTSEHQTKSVAPANNEKESSSDNKAIAANQPGNKLSTQPSSGTNPSVSEQQVTREASSNTSEPQERKTNLNISEPQPSITTKDIRRNKSGTVEKQADNNQMLKSSEPVEQVPAPPAHIITEPQKTETSAMIITTQATPDASATNKPADSKKDSILQDASVSSNETTIPVVNKPKTWHWGAYIGTGPNYVTKPLELGARAMSASPDYSSGGNSGSRTYTSNQEENGWHFAGGITGEKKMGNNWMFTGGLGINSSTWKTTVERYKDSIYNGAFYSSTKVSEERNSFRLWMAELPLQFSNRIAGKKAGSLWWTIGLNNQFRISLHRKSSVDSTFGNSLSDSRTLTSTTRFYQPQFRLGLMYNHNGKVHWQLQPLFQYSFTGVYTPDISDKPVLANLQLQYRLFLQPKKEGKKQAK